MNEYDNTAGNLN